MSSTEVMPFHVILMDLGRTSVAAAVPVFMNVGTESAITTVSSENAPKPTPF